jgi:hypothetical protein
MPFRFSWASLSLRIGCCPGGAALPFDFSFAAHWLLPYQGNATIRLSFRSTFSGLIKTTLPFGA